MYVIIKELFKTNTDAIMRSPDNFMV